MSGRAPIRDGLLAVVICRIKFAIAHVEQFSPRTEQMREAGMQLLDALQRLETADHRFQAARQQRSSRLQTEGTPRAASHRPQIHNGRKGLDRTGDA
jgi:hypothetical protein